MLQPTGDYMVTGPAGSSHGSSSSTGSSTTSHGSESGTTAATSSSCGSIWDFSAAHALLHGALTKSEGGGRGGHHRGLNGSELKANFAVGTHGTGCQLEVDADDEAEKVDEDTREDRGEDKGGSNKGNGYNEGKQLNIDSVPRLGDFTTALWSLLDTRKPGYDTAATVNQITISQKCKKTGPVSSIIKREREQESETVGRKNGDGDGDGDGDGGPGGVALAPEQRRQSPAVVSPDSFLRGPVTGTLFSWKDVPAGTMTPQSRAKAITILKPPNYSRSKTKATAKVQMRGGTIRVEPLMPGLPGHHRHAALTRALLDRFADSDERERSALAGVAAVVAGALESLELQGQPGVSIAEQRLLLPLASKKKGGIHVFVDMSNVRAIQPFPLFPSLLFYDTNSTQISAGFHDYMRASRSIPAAARVPRVPFSFAAFALILERGRPAAKRVLAGSDHLCPAVREAGEIGYETNILHRVPKQQKKKREGVSSGSGSGSASGSGSGSESSPGHDSRHVRAKSRLHSRSRALVEQGVDEILQMKMLESLLDTNQPSTIVLATGDAAAAQYSDGFLRVTERAMARGWAVELVSFRAATSRAYSEKGFRKRWEGRFRIVLLDEFAEYMLDM